MVGTLSYARLLVPVLSGAHGELGMLRTFGEGSSLVKLIGHVFDGAGEDWRDKDRSRLRIIQGGVVEWIWWWMHQEWPAR